MNWSTEPEEDRRLVERGAALFQNVALAVAVVCIIGAIGSLASWWGAP